MKKKEKIPGDIYISIVNFLTNEFSEKDIIVLKRWIAADEKNLSQFNSLREISFLAGSGKGKEEFITDEVWKTLRGKININNNQYAIPINRRKKVWSYLRVAATWLVFFVIGSGCTWWFYMGKDHTTPKTIEIDVPLGAKSTITLPDGSKVWLNAGTKLTYRDDYGRKERSLYLTGEAFFDVAKDKFHPFTVRTSGIVVRALGTKFNIKAYPEEKTVTATLVKGRIDVSITEPGNKSRRVVLSPNEKIIYHKEKNVVDEKADFENVNTDKSKLNKRGISTDYISVLTEVDTKLTTSWKDDRWIIEGEYLGSLGQMLERRYNLKILFMDQEIKKYKFSGTLRNTTIEQILNAIRFTAPLDYKISNDTVWISPDSRYTEKFKRIMNPKSH